MAGLMATGHAKFTGEMGVCLATQGPGAIHLLNGLYDAKLDHQPGLALVGQQARAALGSHSLVLGSEVWPLCRSASARI
jgi:pyruvate dehydrogenase (quinone)